MQLWFSADPATRTRLAFGRHVAKHLLDADASNSTLIRRAMALYAAHLDALITEAQRQIDPNLPSTLKQHAEYERDQKLQREQHALMLCNRGDLTLIPEEQLLVQPVKALKDILKDMKR